METNEEVISKALIKLEMQNLIESSLLTLAETKRIMNTKENVNDYEKGRTDGILLVGMDFIDNFKRFGYRIGVFK